MHHRYAGKKVAFLTQHGKESLVAPLLGPTIGCEISQPMVGPSSGATSDSLPCCVRKATFFPA